MAERLVPFDPQPVGDANVAMRCYISPNGERFYYKATSEGEGYDTQWFHIDGDPVDVRKVDGVWCWVFDDEGEAMTDSDQWPESLRIMREQRERIAKLEAKLADAQHWSERHNAAAIRLGDTVCEQREQIAALEAELRESNDWRERHCRDAAAAGAENVKNWNRVRELEADVERLTEARDKLQRFKDWVHSYLDAKSVPHHPPGTHGDEGCRIGDRMDYVFAEVEQLRAKAHRCEVGSPHSSHGKDHSHASQIAYLEDRCAKARVTYRCDCGFAMEGPYDPTEWPCAKCRQGRLKPEIVREVERLRADLARRKHLISCCDCGGWFEIQHLNQSTPDPQAAPVCNSCLEKESLRADAELWRRHQKLMEALPMPSPEQFLEMMALYAARAAGGER